MPSWQQITISIIHFIACAVNRNPTRDMLPPKDLGEPLLNYVEFDIPKTAKTIKVFGIEYKNY